MYQVLESVASMVGKEEGVVRAIFCVAGGWAGGNASSNGT